jgi:hypothetical protein
VRRNISVKQHVDPGTAIRLRHDVLVHPSGGGASHDVAQECRSPGRQRHSATMGQPQPSCLLNPQHPWPCREAVAVPAASGQAQAGPGLTVEELWYGPDDSTCCPSGRATNTWTYVDGTFRRDDAHVTATPTSRP